MTYTVPRTGTYRGTDGSSRRFLAGTIIPMDLAAQMGMPDAVTVSAPDARQIDGRSISTIPNFDPVASDHTAAIKAAFEAHPGPWVIPPETTVRLAYGGNIDPPDGWALYGRSLETSVLRLSGFTAGDANQSKHTYNVFGAGATIHKGRDSTARRLTAEHFRVIGTKGETFVTDPQQQPSVFGLYGKWPGAAGGFHPYHDLSNDAYDWTFRRVVFENIEGFTIQPAGYSHRVLISECVFINTNNGVNVGSRFATVEKCWFIRAEGVEMSGYGGLVQGCYFIEPKLAAIVFSSGNTIHGAAAIGNWIVGGDCDTSIMVADDAQGGSGDGVAVLGNRIAYAHGTGIRMASDRGVCADNILWDIGQSTGTGGERIAIYVTGADNRIAGNIGYSSSPKLSGLKSMDGSAITLLSDGGIKVEGLRNRLTGNQFRDIGAYDIYLSADSRDTYLDASNDYNPAKLSIISGATLARGSWVQFASPGDIPAAGAWARGSQAYAQGGDGAADVLKIAMKAAGGSYAWLDVAA